MAVTIKDIARIAGVTHSTVSRCLNDKPGVSDAKRAEIKKIAIDLGFEYNANARGLNTSKTGTIGVILNEDADDNQPHLYTNTFLRHIRHQLEEEDLDTLTTFYRNNVSGKDNIVKLVNRRKVDGLIILSSSIDKETVAFLQNEKIPFVFSHQIPSRDMSDINAVYCDHFNGGYLATRHLLEQGRKRILCLSRPDKRYEFSQRTQGFKAALMEMGLPFEKNMVLNGVNDLGKVDEMWDLFSSRIKDVDAVFAHTDIMAIVLIKALQKHGISVPDDIAIVGYDNIALCTFVEPRLTSVAQPSRTISIKTCETLIKLLSGEQICQKTVVPPWLVVRESV